MPSHSVKGRVVFSAKISTLKPLTAFPGYGQFSLDYRFFWYSVISPPGTHGEHLRGGLIASECDNLRVLSRSFDRNNNFLEKFFGKDILIVSLEKYILFFAHMEEGRWTIHEVRNNLTAEIRWLQSCQATRSSGGLIWQALRITSCP